MTKQQMNEESTNKETKRAEYLLYVFSFVLFFLLIAYFVLHWYIPGSGVTPPTVLARDAALGSITQATDILTGTVNEAERVRLQILTNAVTQATGILTRTGTLTGTMNEAERVRLQTLTNAVTQVTGILTRTGASPGPGALTGTVNEAERVHLQALANTLQASVVKLPSVSANSVISRTLMLINTEIAKPQPDRTTLQLLFNQAAEEIKQGSEIWFWSNGAWRWVELAFWSFFGTLIYILTAISKHYPKASQPRQFLDKTPWYLATAVKGPFIVILVLMGLTSLSVDISGLKLDVNNARIEFLIFLAGILGFYSRVAKAQLDSLVKSVFATAWQNAQMPEEITLAPNTLDPLEIGETKRFTIIPDQDVVWSLEPKNLGKLTTNGLYTAPDQLNGVKTVVITATSAVNEKKSASVALRLIDRKDNPKVLATAMTVMD